MEQGEPFALDERVLAEGVKAGTPEACEAFVRSYGGAMRVVAAKILGDDGEADDAVQEAFLSAFRSIERFEGRSSLATWLHRITANVALMRLRARRARPVAVVEDLLPDFTELGCWPEHVEPWSEPEDPVVRDEVCATVRECISRLPEKHRVPLLLRDIEGLGNEEVARRLGVTVNAAKIRVFRARQAVRALLVPLMAELAS